MTAKHVADIEIVEDRTPGTPSDKGFLRVQRLLVRNRYDDGSSSETYDCDVVSRRQTDAVAVLPYDIDAEGRVHVALKSGVRPAVYLRKHKALEHPDAIDLRLLLETPAGLLEDGDRGDLGIAQRAARECQEETGIQVAPDEVESLGGPAFPTPGVSDEKVFFRCVRTRLVATGPRETDGSVMEEAGGLVVLGLDEAIGRCRSGVLPDMKTEVALLRLRDRLDV